MPSGVHENLVDRKSTRLNSSHVEISYAVFCLKKKKLKKAARNITKKKKKEDNKLAKSEVNQAIMLFKSTVNLIGMSSAFFFFNDTATTEIYTLSLHDALPI